MKKRVLSSMLVIALSVGLLLSGCGKKREEKSEDKKEKIIIGTSSVAIDMAESGVKTLEEMGYKVEIKVFDDYFLPNQALVEGEIDANLYQHQPFLDTYNEEKGTEIMMLEPKLWNYWSGIYSVKTKSIDKLPKGGKVGIAEDASNVSLDLLRLQEAGIIKLVDEEKELYDIADIVENPYGYEFVNVDHNKYHNMDDYALVLGSSNTMASFDVNPTENLLKKFVDPTVCHGMCIMPENQDKQWVKDLMEAYTSDTAKAYIPDSAGFVAEF